MDFIAAIGFSVGPCALTRTTRLDRIVQIHWWAVDERNRVQTGQASLLAKYEPSWSLIIGCYGDPRLPHSRDSGVREVGGWMHQTMVSQGFLTSGINVSQEGNSTPLQHSCLENPMDGGA